MGGKLDETLMLLQSAGVLPIIRAKNTDAGALLESNCAKPVKLQL